jgi:hypothetical protein
MFRQCADLGFNTNISIRSVCPVVANTVLTAHGLGNGGGLLLRTQSLLPMVPETVVSESVVSIIVMVSPQWLPIRTHVGATFSTKLGHRTYQQF